MTQIITRFAPSPTGYLHIGGARTALFNWLYARHTGGKFLLRIEDTDRARSTREAMDALLEGLQWLGLNWDEAPVYQSQQIGRHIQVAEALLQSGKAYRCYTSQEELAEFRERYPNEKFRSPWRDGAEPPSDGTLPVIRLKSPMEGEITVHDLLRGTVSVDAKEMDDMVLMRADGTPTYMLAVVVDDHDMGVTHAIRGNDHFTNKFRQLLIYQAMDWTPPKFAHVPLILGEDGTKLSKRHGATGLEQYAEMGFLPDAMRNYLLRLGWSHGDQEIFSDAEAIKYFDFGGLGKSPSRFDLEKLKNINQYYMRQMDPSCLLAALQHFSGSVYSHPASDNATESHPAGGDTTLTHPAGGGGKGGAASTSEKASESPPFNSPPQAGGRETIAQAGGREDITQAGGIGTIMVNEKEGILKKALPWLVERARTLIELQEQSAFLIATRPLYYDEKAKASLTPEAKQLLSEFQVTLKSLSDWSEEILHEAGKYFMETKAIKAKQFMPPLRAALSGKGASAGTVFQIMDALGKEETLGRMADALST